MIHILTPSYGEPDAYYTLSLLRACIDLGVARVPYCVGMVVGVTPIDIARNEAVAMFLDGDASHLMFIDDDMQFTARDIIQLREANKPIVGAVCPKRGNGYAVTPMAEPIVEDHLVSVHHVGTGFMLIQREVILKMIGGPPVRTNAGDRWPLFQSGVDVERQQYVSEDYAFCVRAKALGFQPWVHTGLRIGHVGKMVYQGGTEAQRRAAVLPAATEAAE